MNLDTTPSKLHLLTTLSTSINDWSGNRPPNRAMVRTIRHHLGLLAACDMSQLEQWKLRGCEYCFRLAQERRPREWLRKAWLMEIYHWQLLVESGCGYDSRPERPPRNRVYEEALISHQRPEYGLPRSPF